MSIHNIWFCAEIRKCRGVLNEYPQHMFSCIKKKNAEALLMSTSNICFRAE